VKAIDRDRVVAHDQVRMQADGCADRRDVAQRLGRHCGAVADAAAEDHDVIRAPHRDLSTQQRDHRRAPAAAIALLNGAAFI
jgi:hypothetical protein